jgi:uncharacterized protein (TIGR00369 family)
MEPAAVNAMWKGLLAEHLGMRFVETGPDRVVAELEVRDHLRTIRGTVHAVGGTAALINLPEGAATATIESKTNFFAAGKAGIIRAEATPLHKGRSTSVWQTRVTDESGKLLSLTIQTQAVLQK